MVGGPSCGCGSPARRTSIGSAYLRLMAVLLGGGVARAPGKTAVREDRPAAALPSPSHRPIPGCRRPWRGQFHRHQFEQVFELASPYAGGLTTSTPADREVHEGRRPEAASAPARAP